LIGGLGPGLFDPSIIAMFSLWQVWPDANYLFMVTLDPAEG